MTIAELIVDLFEQLGSVAVHDAISVRVFNDGPAARFVALDPTSGLTFAALVEHGESISVNRGMRLLIQPIDSQVLRPLDVVQQRWSTT